MFIRGSNPVWYFVNLSGVQFDDSYYMWVLENEVPYIPTPVYELPNGTPWANPVRFLSNGTLPVNIFWDDTKLYRLEIRQNVDNTPPTQSDPLIYLIENYSPAGQPDEPVTVDGVFTGNQISNPQFSDVGFTSPLVLTGVTDPDPIPIAPDWTLTLTGTGNATISLVPLNDALENPTNAPYALRLDLSGWTGLPVLSQRFNQNGMLWAEKFVSNSITARVVGTPSNIVTRLDASDGMPLGILISQEVQNDFDEYLGTIEMPMTVNSDLPPDAWIDYKILLQPNVDIYLTSIQLVVSDLDQEVTYEQDTIQRQEDHLFHYYKPLLEYKPTPSWLVGWNFPYNPAQFGETVTAQAVGAEKSYYAWDQTILFQEKNSGLSVTRNTSGGITIESVAVGGGQFAVIQYLTATQAKDILTGKCSVGIKGRSSLLSVDYAVSLFAKTGALPDLTAGTNNSIVARLDVDGTVLTQNGTWTALTHQLPVSVLGSLNTEPAEYYHSYWQDNVTAPVGVAATFFAIVIGFESIAQNESVTLEWVTLNRGKIPTPPVPQTESEVLHDCMYFYEKSFDADVLPAAIDLDNSRSMTLNTSAPYDPGGGDLCIMLNPAFTAEFIQPKYSEPDLYVYDPVSQAVDNVNIRTIADDVPTPVNTPTSITAWTINTGTKAAYFEPATRAIGAPIAVGGATGVSQLSATLNYHYIADARLGIV